jgi:hypothetical protein
MDDVELMMAKHLEHTDNYLTVPCLLYFLLSLGCRGFGDDGRGGTTCRWRCSSS